MGAVTLGQGTWHGRSGWDGSRQPWGIPSGDAAVACCAHKSWWPMSWWGTVTREWAAVALVTKGVTFTDPPAKSIQKDRQRGGQLLLARGESLLQDCQAAERRSAHPACSSNAQLCTETERGGEWSSCLVCFVFTLSSITHSSTQRPLPRHEVVARLCCCGVGGFGADEVVQIVTQQAGGQGVRIEWCRIVHVTRTQRKRSNYSMKRLRTTPHIYHRTPRQSCSNRPMAELPPAQAYLTLCFSPC